MPIFEYQCKKCEHVTTFLESFNGKKPHECEECGSRNTVKLVSTFATRVTASSAGPSCPTGTCPLS